MAWSVDLRFVLGAIDGSSAGCLPLRIPVVSPCLEVWATTRERAMAHDMGDYFARKFFPLQVMFVLGRSFAAEPMCEPRVTVYDLRKELAIQALVTLI